MNSEISKSELLLRDAPIAPLFLRYAIPSVIGLLFFGVQTLIDALIVGNFIGADALAGVNLVVPFYSIAAVLVIMTGIGSQTVINIGLGEGDYNKAKDAMTTGFLAVIIFGALMPLICYPQAERLSLLVGADAKLLPYSTAYIRGFMPFIPAVLTMFYSDYMLKATGHPRYAMVVMTSTVILNAGLSILFVTVLNKGTAGVGMATGISFLFGAIASSFITFNRGRKLYMLAGKFRPKLLWEMLYNGSSEGVTELSAGISIIIMNITLMKYASSEGVAAFTAINYTYFLGITLFLGISDGIIPIISYNHGADNHKRVASVLKMAMKVNFIIGVVLFLSLFLFGDNIISLFFNSKDAYVIEIADKGAKIYSIAFLMSGINILSSSFFTAIAHAGTSIMISLSRGLIFTAIGLTILPDIFGIEGIWASTPIAEFITLSITITLIYKYFKKKKAL